MWRGTSPTRCDTPASLETFIDRHASSRLARCRCRYGAPIRFSRSAFFLAMPRKPLELGISNCSYDSGLFQNVSRRHDSLLTSNFRGIDRSELCSFGGLHRGCKVGIVAVNRVVSLRCSEFFQLLDRLTVGEKPRQVRGHSLSNSVHELAQRASCKPRSSPSALVSKSHGYRC